MALGVVIFWESKKIKLFVRVVVFCQPMQWFLMNVQAKLMEMMLTQRIWINGYRKIMVTWMMMLLIWRQLHPLESLNSESLMIKMWLKDILKEEQNWFWALRIQMIGLFWLHFPWANIKLLIHKVIAENMIKEMLVKQCSLQVQTADKNI